MVNRSATSRHASALQWYAVAGPPLAWASQLLLGYFYTEAACRPADLRLPEGIHAPETVLTVAMAAVAAGAWACALMLHRGTSQGELRDPVGRVRFIADVGLVVGAIFFALIIYTGSAVLAVSECR
jgi:hypothetical protein